MHTVSAKRMTGAAAVLAAAAVIILFMFSCGKDRCGIKREAAQEKAVSSITVSSPAESPTLVDLGGGEAGVSWKEYTGDGSVITCIDVIGVRTDELLASLRLDGDYGVYAADYDGGLMLYSSDCLTYVLLDSRLNTVRSVTMPENCYGEPSYDLRYFYYVNEGYLTRMDTETHESLTVELPYGMRAACIGECSAKAGLLTVNLYTNQFENETCCGIYDVGTGELLMLDRALQEPHYDGELFAMTSFGERTVGEAAKFFDLMTWGHNDGELTLRSVSDSDLHHPDGWEHEFVFDGRSPYIVGNYRLWDSEAESYACRAYLYALNDNVDFCNLTRYGVEGTVCGARYMPDEQLMLFCTSTQTGTFGLCAVDMTKLEFSFDCEGEPSSLSTVPDALLCESIGQSRQIKPVPYELSDLRARADRLEEQFGVMILMSDQCAGMNGISGYEAIMTSDYDIFTEREYINNALDTIEYTLGLYPQGFFRQFRDCCGGYGMRILLTGPLSGEAAAVGLQFNYSNWYNIMMDIKYGIQVGTLSHEIWHATESRLPSAAADELYNGTWEACNPEGFEYYYDYETDSHEDWSRWLYLYDPDNAYFIDTYAKCYPAEDRARIMEYIMGNPGQADIIMQSPALYRKMEILCRAVRAGFDTTGWDNIWWERYLPEQEAAA